MENPVNCVKNASVPEPKTLSLGWAVQNFWLQGNVYRWGHSFFCDQGMVAKACHGMGGQSPIIEHSALVLLPFIESHGIWWSSPWIYVVMSWTGGFSRVCMPRWRAENMHPVRFWGAEGWWCRRINHLCHIHMSSLEGPGTRKMWLFLQ